MTQKNDRSGSGPLLRLGWEDCVEDVRFRALCEHLRKCPVREITFFSCRFHSPHPLPALRTFAERFRERAPVLREMGVRVGIDHLATVGFFRQAEECSERSLPVSVRKNGEERPGRACSGDPATRAYIEESYRILAQAGPDLLYVDDDLPFRPDGFCYCLRCLQRFEQACGLFRRYGLPPTRESLFSAPENGDLRRAWVRFQNERTADLYALIEKTVHAVSPKTELGMMVYGGPFPRSAAQAWVAALRGEAETVRFRPGGGLYTDREPDALLPKLADMARQCLFLPPRGVRVEAEVECFPYQSLAKSLRFLALEAVNALAIGCSNVAWSLFGGPCGGCSPTAAEYRGRWDLLRRSETFLRDLSAILAGSTPVGVTVWHGYDPETDLRQAWDRDPDDPAGILLCGVPVTFDPRNAAAILLTGDVAQRSGEKAVRAAFDRPMLLTGEAACVLERRSFGDLTGVTVAPCPTDAIEYALPEGTDGRVNGVCFPEECRARDAVQAFRHLEPDNKGYTVRLCGEGTYTAELRNYGGMRLGPSAAKTVNAAGRRVAVTGYAATGYAQSHLRLQQIRDLFAYLTGGIDHVNSCHRILFLERECADGRVCGVLSNFSLDDARNVVLRLRDRAGISDLRLLTAEGERRVTPEPMGTEDGYAVYRIGRIPALTGGYFTIQKEKTDSP